MKDFNDFNKYLDQNIDEVIYDAFSISESSGLDVLHVKRSEEIASISLGVVVSVLRQYHEWLGSNDQ